MKEPLLHSGITDELPEDHPLARESVYCVKCGAMIHGIPNENMRPWMETGRGAWCLEDFTAAFREDDNPEAWALDAHTDADDTALRAIFGDPVEGRDFDRTDGTEGDR